MTKLLDFPIPYPGQLPSDDLVNARMMLAAVTTAMEENKGLAPSEAHSLFVILCTVMTKLDVIQIFLDDVECPDLEQQYQAARRLWTVQTGGAS